MKPTLKRKLWTTLFLLAAGTGVAFSGFLFGMSECYFPPHAEWKKVLQSFANTLNLWSICLWLPVLIIQWSSKKYKTARFFLYGWIGIALLGQLGWLCCNG